MLMTITSVFTVAFMSLSNDSGWCWTEQINVLLYIIML